MAYNRADIRLEVRDEINEAVADLISDNMLNRHIKRELRSLPRKGVYLEELWTMPTVVNQNDYTLPTGTRKVEMVERNEGTSTRPEYEEIKGWDNYAGALYLPFLPTTIWTMRIHLKKMFADVSDDVTSFELPDEKMDVLILGTSIRCYRSILGYLKDAKNWDAIAKPDGVSLRQILELYQQVKKDYQEAINLYKTDPRPRDIDLIG